MTVGVRSGRGLKDRGSFKLAKGCVLYMMYVHVEATLLTCSTL